MKKRTLLTLLLIVAILVPVLSIQAQDETVTITWWGTERGRDTAATRDVHFQLARAFEEANPGINVAVSLFPSRGFNTRVATAIAGGVGPDVWYHTLPADAADQGFLLDLTPLMERDGINPEELWFSGAEQRMKYDGRYYGAPRDAVSALVFYNIDIFEAAGVELPQAGWTIDDFRSIANQLTDRDNDLYGVGAIIGGDGCTLWSSFSFNLGADTTSPDGRQVAGYLDTPEAANAFRYCLELVTEDQVTAPAELQDQFGELVFLSGQVAMQSGSNWEIPAIQGQADFAWGAIESPRFNADTEGIPWTDSISYSVWEGSSNQEAAWELVKWLSGSDAQRMAAEANVWFPNSPAIWQELGWGTDPILGISYNELLKDTVIPNYLRSRYFFDCAYSVHANARVRWVENGERDIEAILAEETANAQSCLDDNYGG